jgi:hypothetical protein
MSGAGVSRGLRNNNPGNIRRSKIQWDGMAAQQTDPAFIQFTDATYGLRAILRIVHTYESRGLVTVRGWISAWAPPSENDTGAYVTAVANAIGCGSDDPVRVEDEATAIGLLRGIVMQENGSQPYDAATLDQAYQMAFPTV